MRADVLDQSRAGLGQENALDPAILAVAPPLHKAAGFQPVD